MAQLPTLPGAMAVPLTQQAVGTLPPDVLSTLMGQQQAQQRAFAMATGAVARPLMPAMAPEPQIAQPNGFSIAPFVFEAGMDSQHSGGSGARFKSHKQQEANKIAQQRYRERKKQKFSEMERTVGELQQQLAALQSMQQRNKILEGMNSELQKQLVDREREVERLKIVLDEQADATLVSEDSTGEGESPSAGGGDAPFYTKPLPVAEDGMVACVPCDILPRDLNNIDFKAGFADQMAQLKDFVTKHGLDAADAMGELVRCYACFVLVCGD